MDDWAFYNVSAICPRQVVDVGRVQNMFGYDVDGHKEVIFEKTGMGDYHPLLFSISDFAY